MPECGNEAKNISFLLQIIYKTKYEDDFFVVVDRVAIKSFKGKRFENLD